MANGKRFDHRPRFIIVGVSAVLVGLVAGTASADLTDGAVVGVIAGLLIAAANLLLDLADFFRSSPPEPEPTTLADQLAQEVKKQWEDEAGSRGLRDDGLLPMSWTVSRHRSDVAGKPRTADGQTSNAFEEAIRMLATSYGDAPYGRIILLGEPGAGKSVLALMLCVGLIRQRKSGAPVPVLLSVSTWDPLLTKLDNWLIQTLANAYYNGRRDIPIELLRLGLLIPILDGVDEIPDAARRRVVRRLNEAIGPGCRPVVVTCRTHEYEDLIGGGSPVLSGAPVIRVNGLSPSDMSSYLSAHTPQGAEGWKPVFDDLEVHPDGPVAQALSLPLSVSLARFVYQRLQADPSALVTDRKRFDSRAKIEDFLTAEAVSAGYADGSSRQSARAKARLSNLASVLHERDERDIAWWQVSERSMPAWALPSLALVFGVVTMLILAACAAAIAPRLGWTINLIFSGGSSMALALLTVMIWFSNTTPKPQRLSWRSRDSGTRMVDGFRAGLLVAASMTAPVLLVIAMTITVSASWSLVNIVTFIQTIGGAAGVALVAGLAVGAQRRLSGGKEQAESADSPTLLRQDRRASLAGAGAAGLVAILLLPALVGGAWSAGLVGFAMTEWPGWPGDPGKGGTLYASWQDITSNGYVGQEQTVIALIVAPALVLAFLTMLTRAWLRYKVASLVLAVLQRQPFNLSAFLEDAQRRGLLRRTGAVYQFRHIRLQEQLAGGDGGSDGSDVADPQPRRRRMVRLAAATLAVLIAAVGALVALPKDDAGYTLTGDYAGGPYAATFSPDGSDVALCGSDPKVRLFSMENPRQDPQVLELSGPCSSVQFAPDSSVLLALAEKNGKVSTGEVWNYDDDWRSPPFPWVVDTEDPPSLWFVRGAQVAALESPSIGQDGDPEGSALMWWSYRTQPRPADATAGPRNVQLNRDRTAYASWDSRTKTYLLWHVTGTRLPEGKQESFTWVDFSRDGRWVATDSAAGIEVRAVQDGQVAIRLTGLHVTEKVTIQESDESARWLFDDSSGSLRILDPMRRSIALIQDIPGGLDSFVADRDASTVATLSSSGDVQIWDNGGRLKRELGHVPAGSALVDLSKSGDLLGIEESAGESSKSGDETEKAISVWLLNQDPPRKVFIPIANADLGLDEFASSIVGTTSGSGKDQLSLWTPAISQRPTFTLPTDDYTSLDQLSAREAAPTMTVSNKLIAAQSNYDGTRLLMLDVDKPEQRVLSEDASPLGPEEPYDYFLPVSPTLFAIAEWDDDAVQIWDAKNGKCMARLAGHAGPIDDIAVNPVKPFIATSGIDGTVRLWDISVSALTEFPSCSGAPLT